jgi:PAS domain S-box-containing protein
MSAEEKSRGRSVRKRALPEEPGAGAEPDLGSRRPAELCPLEEGRRSTGAFARIRVGYALHEILLDEEGQPCNYRFLDINPAFEKLTGLTAKRVQGQTVLDLLPDTERYWIETYGKVALTGTPVHFDTYSSILGKWFEAYAFRPTRGQFAVLYFDITERKRAEERLRSLASIPEENLNPVLRVRQDGRLMYANEAGRSLLRAWGTEDGQSLPDSMTPIVQQVMEQGSPRKIELSADGRCYFFSLVPGAPGENRSADGGDGYLNLYGQDITGLRRAERDRERHLKGLASMVRVSTEIMAEKSLEGLLQRVVEAARQLTRARLGTCGHRYVNGGFQSGATSQADELPPGPPEAGWQAARGGVHRKLIGKTASLRLNAETLQAHPAWLRLPPGSAPPRGLLGARLVDVDGTPNGLIMVSDKAGGGEFSAQDEALLTQLAAVTSLALQHIEARRSVESQRDRLERLTQSLEQQVAERTAMAERRARQLQAMALELSEVEEGERRRIGELLHEDLQQLLASAKYQLQALQRPQTGDGPPDPLMRQVDRLLEQSIQKCRSLSQELSPPILHLGGLVLAMEWLAQQMKEKYGLAVDIEVPRWGRLENEPLRIFLFRAVQELLLNVVRHSGVKAAKIRLQNLDDRIEIDVSDQGRGFDPGRWDALEGFGLLNIRERVSFLGGSVDIDSTPGGGSRFRLTIPLRGLSGPRPAEREAPPAAETVPAGTGWRAPGARLRVLLADDHQVIRQGLVTMLESQPDLQVVGEASNGREALELALKLRPDVILMDVSMPEMDGIAATRRIKRRMPQVRVIGLSMYDEGEVEDRMRKAGADAYTCKSEPAASLMNVIRGMGSIPAV